MNPETIKKFYETIARIISEREKVKVTVTVREKPQEKPEKAEAC